MGRRGYPPEFRRRALDLLDAGRKVVDLARDLGISNQTIYVWRRQEAIDRGLVAGLTSAEREELAAVARRLPPQVRVECWRWDDKKREPMIRTIEEFSLCS